MINDYEEEEPRAGMTFLSEVDVTKFYKNYAKCKGFGIEKICSKKEVMEKNILL